MFDKLDKAKARYELLAELLSAPDAMADQDKWRERVKEHAELSELVNTYETYRQAEKDAEGCKLMLAEETDPELREMAHTELSELEGEDKLAFLADLGIEESGLDRLISASYSLLGLISYLTAGPKEVRAWTIKRGTKAPGAAGKIHSDFERGFIRAEVVAFDDLVREGDRNKVKEKGLLRSEGKEYVMNDGDIVLFRFNV